ncbi:hypothetical protein MTO96_033924 [Rhipicephalus appendiculatus]
MARLETFDLCDQYRNAQHHATFGASFWHTRKWCKHQVERTRLLGGCQGEQRGSYNLPQRGSDSPRLASSQSRKRGNFKCRYCGRTFVYMTPFIAHEYAHANEKRFLCNFCPPGLCHSPAVDCPPARPQG